MAISNTVVRATYVADGVLTAFAIPSTIISSDLAETVVYSRVIATGVATLQVQGAMQDYTLTGATPPTTPFNTTVTFNTAPIVGVQIIVFRILTLTQPVDVNSNSEVLPATTIETEFDRLTAISQQLQEEIDRSLKLALTSPTKNVTITEPTAGYILRWNATADGIESINDTGFTSNTQAQLDGKQPLDSTLTALAAYNTAGLITQTSVDTFTGRTITGTTDQIVVTNGNGVSGNPTLSTPQSINTTSSPTFVGETLSGLTASTALTANASKAITSSSTTDTELGYVHGVTSALQTQLNTKQASGNYITALTGDATASGPGSVAATLATVNSNVGSFGSATKASVVTVNGKGLVTAASESTVTPAVGSITGLATGVATFLATPTSANLIAALTDETGTGASVFATSPTLVTPILGTPTSGTLTSCTGLPLTSGVTGTLPIANGGTNNGSLSVTAGVTYYADGSKIVGLANGSAGTFLKSNGTTLAPTWGNPTISLTAPTVQKFTSSSGTYTTAANVLYIRVRMVGGGGGGGYSGNLTSGATAGGNSTFGTTLLVANGGAGGGGGGTASGGAGGTGSLGSGPIGTALSGGSGTGSGGGALAINIPSGGEGAPSFFGGGGGGGTTGNNGNAGAANTGGGGGGAGSGGVNSGGAGGGAGGFVDAIIISPSATYAYAVGAVGAGGVGSTASGGAGGSGYIEVVEYFQ